jgi:hypothetical protein
VNLGNDSNWEYETAAGVDLDLFSTNVGAGLTSDTGGTTAFRLSHDFGNSLDAITVTFRAKENNQRQHFFMMTLLLAHDIGWSGVQIRVVEELAFMTDIGDREHPDRAHIHTLHNVDGGPNNDGLTPDPNIGAGVAAALYGGALAANDAWEPERLRLHDMSTNAYEPADMSTRRGPMRFRLIIKPVGVPEPSTMLMFATVLLGLTGSSVFRHRT